LQAMPDRSRRRGPGRWRAGPRTGVAWPVGGAAAADELRQPRASGWRDAGCDLRPGDPRQPVRRPASGLARDAGDAGDAAQVAITPFPESPFPILAFDPW